MKMDTPSENSISWGGIIFVALARNVLVIRLRSAIVYEEALKVAGFTTLLKDKNSVFAFALRTFIIMNQTGQKVLFHLLDE